MAIEHVFITIFLTENVRRMIGCGKVYWRDPVELSNMFAAE